jgi:hypothetical protein
MGTSDVDRWKTAFSLFVATLVAGAEQPLDERRAAVLQAMYPPDRLRALGLADEDGSVTPAYPLAYREAMRELPARLSLSEKLEIVTDLHRATLADGPLALSELLVVREAAEILGVPRLELTKHLDRLTPFAPDRR